MKGFHDVEIYAGSGCELATTGSRLELGATSDFLRSLFAGISLCDGCKEPLVIICPQDDKNTVRAAFNSLAHFDSGMSIIQDPEKLNNLLSRMREKPQSETVGSSSFIQHRSTISISDGVTEAESDLVERLSEEQSELVRVRTVEEREEREERETANNNSTADVLCLGDFGSVSTGDTEKQKRKYSRIHGVDKTSRVPQQLKEIRTRKLQISVENMHYDPPSDQHENQPLKSKGNKSDVALGKRKLCHLCRQVSKSRSQLYNHYSITHYKKELMSLIDKKTLQCQFCGFQRNKIELLIPHIGSVHGKLENYLPPKFHLPRSRSARKFSKTSSASRQGRPVELGQATSEQTADSGASVNSHQEDEEDEIPRTVDPDTQDKETDLPQEESVQTFKNIEDLRDLRKIFDSDSDSDF